MQLHDLSRLGSQVTAVLTVVEHIASSLLVQDRHLKLQGPAPFLFLLQRVLQLLVQQGPTREFLRLAVQFLGPMPLFGAEPLQISIQLVEFLLLDYQLLLQASLLLLQLLHLGFVPIDLFLTLAELLLSIVLQGLTGVLVFFFQ